MEKFKRWFRMNAGTIIVVELLLLCTVLALARDNGQWANQPADVREWFDAVMMPDKPLVSCCGEADAYEATPAGDAPGGFQAKIIDGKGVIPDGTLVFVPKEKVQAAYGNPTGKDILFMGEAGTVYCYIPQAGL